MIEQPRVMLFVVIAPHRGLEPCHFDRVEGPQIRLPRPAGIGDAGSDQNRQGKNDPAALN
jgi:hypothetical protein